MQNVTHIRYLQKQIGYRVPIFSIIVFFNRCSFKKMDVYNDKVKVCHLNNVSNVILNIYDSTNFVMTNEEINNINKKLSLFENADEIIKETHIEHIKNRYKKY